MQNSQRYRSLLFLALLLMPACWFTALLVYESWLEHRAEERMESRQLTTVLLHPQQVVWIKPGKELLINGQLFDVKTCKQAPRQQLAFTGVYDAAEMQVKQLLKRFRQQQQQKRQQPASAWLLSVLQPAEPVPPFLLPPPSGTCLQRLFMPQNRQNRCCWYPSVPTPPPNRLFLA